MGLDGDFPLLGLEDGIEGCVGKRLNHFRQPFQREHPLQPFHRSGPFLVAGLKKVFELLVGVRYKPL
jgi:hypothetical protein